MKLYLSYNERRYGGEVCEGQEDYSFPSYEDEFIEWNLLDCSLTRNKDNWYQEEVDIDFETKINRTVYVVFVRYSDGDTFGCTRGYWTIIGVYKTLSQAKKVVKSIEDGSYKEYKPWDGYFANFESCSFRPMTVLP